MKCNGTATRSFRALCLVAVSVLSMGPGLVSCSERPLDREITEVRPKAVRPGPGVSSSSRAGMPSSQNRPSGSDTGTAKFIWETPEGWTQRPPTQLRAANFQVGGDPNAECYLTILPGMGGGLVDNVNRWRNQIGLEPQSDEEIRALPKRLLFGNEATIVELEGAYSGMGDNAVEGSALIGAVLAMPEGMLFVKMTGPLELIRANRTKFDEFCDSLDLAGAAGHDHSTHEPGAHDDEPAPSGAASASSSPDASSGLAWTAPDGWTELPAKSMRVVSYKLGASGTAECYISVLGGTGGGIEMNVNRWRTQVGESELPSSEIASLPTLNILGVQSPWVEAYGDFSGIGADDLSNAGILGAICVLGNQSIFVKMVGPASELREARQGFISFCESLRTE